MSTDSRDAAGHRDRDDVASQTKTGSKVPPRLHVQTHLRQGSGRKSHKRLHPLRPMPLSAEEKEAYELLQQLSTSMLSQLKHGDRLVRLRDLSRRNADSPYWPPCSIALRDDWNYFYEGTQSSASSDSGSGSGSASSGVQRQPPRGLLSRRVTLGADFSTHSDASSRVWGVAGSDPSSETARFVMLNEVELRRVAQLASPKVAMRITVPKFDAAGFRQERSHARSNQISGWSLHGWKLIGSIEKLWAGCRNLAELVSGITEARSAVVVKVLLETVNLHEATGLTEDLNLRDFVHEFSPAPKDHEARPFFEHQRRRFANRVNSGSGGSFTSTSGSDQNSPAEPEPRNADQSAASTLSPPAGPPAQEQQAPLYQSDQVFIVDEDDDAVTDTTATNSSVVHVLSEEAIVFEVAGSAHAVVVQAENVDDDASRNLTSNLHKPPVTGADFSDSSDSDGDSDTESTDTTPPHTQQPAHRGRGIVAAASNVFMTAAAVPHQLRHMLFKTGYQAPKPSESDAQKQHDIDKRRREELQAWKEQQRQQNESMRFVAEMASQVERSVRSNEAAYNGDRLMKETHQRELEFAQARQQLVTAFISVRTLSDFEVLSKLGAGNNGMVLMCRVNSDAINSIKPNLVVAVKLLFNFGVDGAQLDQMSAAEYTSLAVLPSHPNVVALLATVGPAPLTEDMTAYLPPAIRQISEDYSGSMHSLGIVMEYHPVTLEDFLLRVQKDPSLATPQDLYNMCIQVLRAVYWIFRHGVFHLDLKLNNFMVASDNRRVVLVDFGCARHETGLRRLGQQGLLQPQVFEKNFDLIWNEATTAVGADHGLEGNLTHRAPEVIASLNALASLPSNRHRGQNANTADDPDAAWVSLAMQPSFACGVLLHEIAFGTHPVPAYPLGDGAAAMFRTSEKYLRSLTRDRSPPEPLGQSDADRDGSVAQEAASPSSTPMHEDSAIIRSASSKGGKDSTSSARKRPLKNQSRLAKAGLAFSRTLLRVFNGLDKLPQAAGAAAARSDQEFSSAALARPGRMGSDLFGKGDINFEEDTEWKRFVKVKEAPFRKGLGWEKLGPRALNHLRSVISHLVHPVPRSRLSLPTALSNLEDALAWCTRGTTDPDEATSPVPKP